MPERLAVKILIDDKEIAQFDRARNPEQKETAKIELKVVPEKRALKILTLTPDGWRDNLAKVFVDGKQPVEKGHLTAMVWYWPPA